MDFIGANLGTSATSVSVSGLSKYTSQLFDVLHEVALKPLFDADAFVKLQNQTLTGMKSQDDDPGAIQSKVYGATLYGKDHPYGEYSERLRGFLFNVLEAQCGSIDSGW